MEEKTSCGPGCQCDPESTEAPAETDVQFHCSEDARFAVLLLLVPMLTLSMFNMMGFIQ